MGSATDSGNEFFEKKIRPVLVEHCYRCHSSRAPKLKGGLSLESRANVLKGGDTGPALVPGKPEQSLLLKAVRYTEEGLRMPPTGKLPDAIIADLTKWIGMGAPDPRVPVEAGIAKKAMDIEEGRKFWAYQSPRHRPIPPVRDAAWPATGIDRFILSRLEAQGLKPAADADRRTLVRRAYFDLTGLPPAPDQIESFLRDSSPNAFARLVDRLLQSPHFGEHWARHWLDISRFAESSGGGRSLLFKDAWRYRDYVIASLNADKPFDRFVAEQIAGDLLPYQADEERAQNLIATAFLALGPTNYERQDKDTLEMDVVDEQLDTIGRAFLGMTIGCARCHDHKFDPIPTRDYYAMAGILHSTQTLIHDNVSRWVDQALPMTPEQGVRIKQHESLVAALREQIKRAKAAEGKAAAAGPLRAADLPGIVVDDAQAKRVGPWKKSKYKNTFIGDGYLYDDRGVAGEKTLTFVPHFQQGGRYEVRLAYVPHTNRATRVAVSILAADGEHTLHLNQRAEPTIEGRFVSLGTYRFEPGDQWYVLLSTEGANGHVVADAVQFLPEEKLDKPAPPSPAAVKDSRPDLRRLEAELKRLTDQGPQRPVAMSVKDLAGIHDCHICIRGNTHNKGELVPRGVLQVATVGPPPLMPARASGRLELAAWLTAPNNPLTARVLANRVWHHLFGIGLVRTVDVLGTAGEPPSHPELLDELALQLLRENWSLKKLIRSIMLSRTYQLSSTAPNKAAAIDPENRLLWRQNRRRLPAEAIRDTMLLVGGRLDRTLGGPTVRNGTTTEIGYLFEGTRRSIYVPVFRNQLLELFEVFDFADPNLVGGRRAVSTVPTQALYLLNSPFVISQCREMARGATLEKLETRVEHAYQSALGRPPTERELQLATDHLKAATSPTECEAAWATLYQALMACIDFRYLE